MTEPLGLSRGPAHTAADSLKAEGKIRFCMHYAGHIIPVNGKQDKTQRETPADMLGRGEN